MPIKTPWKTIANESQLSAEPPVNNSRRFAWDTGREYIGDGSAWQNVNITHRGAWDTGTAYLRQDVVTHEGNTWRAKRPNIGVEPDENDDWTLMGLGGQVGPTGPQGPAGPTGPTGGGVTIRGAWDSGTDYFEHDAVTYDGSFWRALRPNTNVPPVEGLDWNALALRGADGEPGPEGEAGPEGDQGPTGAGVPAGGAAGQFLVKSTSSDYATEWKNRGRMWVTTFDASIDIASGMTVNANTWTDLLFDMSFTIQASNGYVEIRVGGMIWCATAASNTNGTDRISSAIYLNNATRYVLGGDNMRESAGGNYLAGAAPLVFTNLAAGSHILDLQLCSSVTSVARCRPATHPNFEELRIFVIERVD